MAGMPIPTDWDGSSWCCEVVEWPSSPEWAAIFRGLLTYAQKGRFWDEATGSVVDAQQVGLQIFLRNCTFKEDN